MSNPAVTSSAAVIQYGPDVGRDRPAEQRELGRGQRGGQGQTQLGRAAAAGRTPPRALPAAPRRPPCTPRPRSPRRRPGAARTRPAPSAPAPRPATDSAVERSPRFSRSTGAPSAASVTAPRTSARPRDPHVPPADQREHHRRDGEQDAAEQEEHVLHARRRGLAGGTARQVTAAPGRPGAAGWSAATSQARRCSNCALRASSCQQLGVEEPQLLGRGRNVRHAAECGRRHAVRHECGYSGRTQIRAPPCARAHSPHGLDATTASAAAGPCPRRPPPCTPRWSGPRSTRGGGRRCAR